MSQGNDAFIVLSINHEKASLEVRERYSVDERRVDELYQKLHQRIADESLVLNTCNRFELYAKLGDGVETNDVVRLISAFYGHGEDDLKKHLHLRQGREAVQHLIEVSAGLRSQITGEAEIFGQVKSAYALSQKSGYAGKVINRVFQKGFQAAKFIRNSTSVGQGQINISNVAVELASKIFGSLSKAAVLSLGTGEIGEKTVKALRSRGAKRFGVASRSLERAQSVASEWGGTPHTVADLQNYLPQYDIVIASVGSDDPIITEGLLNRCASKRNDRPLFLIDLGLPRNVEKRCEDLDNVFLYNLDDLAAIAEENLNQRKQAMQECVVIAKTKSGYIWDALMKRGLG
ncbi:glutamyl-tRNA reductase [Pelagicoccus sp. SDUM812003]|uniref:glutamyl-tRNA reductase n=1 Tax=Pelagicoccus sp. SDUM812003 TaxID=3041267 RepID=UPI00280DA300|nr:glutamyl-tRNA reductase [Pelagicoccus sp. SDUM812003]MDQ8205077.1 glutamyl-tRNA reductase [Pelagicoccus sp. SDUM812003]